MTVEYGRYNPDSKHPRYPYQWKTGRLGKARRSNTITSRARMRRELKANPGKWLVLKWK